MDWFHRIWQQDLATADAVFRVLRAAVFLVVGLILARLAAAGAARFMRSRATAQGVMVTRRVVFYSLLGVAVASSLRELGFQIGVLLGAAGVLTVAVGFAAQTSVSNLISGLFVITERSFVVGDIVTIEDVTGEVLSIDLLSVKIRTYDNLFVRVPNETVIKSRVTTLTHFPIRRVDLYIGVAYKEDLRKVRDLVFQVADRNPLSLEEPPPRFIFERYGDSALEFQFSVWARRENYLEMRTTIQIEIKEAFDAHGIEIPFPHRTIYAGSATEPMPVRMVE